MDRYYHLSTIDNPYSPVTQFDNWLAFDQQQGYNTCAYLSRVVESKHKNFDELSLEEQKALIASATEQIVNEDPLGIYIRIPY